MDLHHWALACDWTIGSENVVPDQAPGPSAGVDVDENGTGLLRDGRLYQLVRQNGTVREQTLEITFLKRGAQAYAFTFR